MPPSSRDTDSISANDVVKHQSVVLPFVTLGGGGLEFDDVVQWALPRSRNHGRTQTYRSKFRSFQGKESLFIWGEHSQGGSQGRVGSECLTTKFIAPPKNTEPGSFQTTSMHQLTHWFAKFCQHHLDWIRADRLLALWSPCGKTKKHCAAHTHSNG